MKKKAFALSVNFIVLLIISIVIFGIGMYIISQFFNFAEEEKLRWDDLTRNEIDAALDDGGRVAIPRYKKTATNGEFVSFGAGIYNVLQGGARTFRVKIEFVLASAGGAEFCNQASAGSCGTPNSWLRTVYDDDGPIEFNTQIKNNEKMDFLVGADISGAPGGTYIFNVFVDYIDDTGALVPYEAPHKLYVEVPGRPGVPGPVFTLTSPDIVDGIIRADHRCGSNNPELNWINVPTDTKSFALLFENPSAGFTHWMVKDIPGTYNRLDRNTVPGGASVVLINGEGDADYKGPCNASDNYYITLYALDEISIPAGNKAEFLAQVESNTLARTVLVTTY